MLAVLWCLMVAAKKNNFKRENYIVRALPLSFLLFDLWRLCVCCVWIKMKMPNHWAEHRHTQDTQPLTTNSIENWNKKTMTLPTHSFYFHLIRTKQNFDVCSLFDKTKNRREKKTNRWKADEKRAKSSCIFVSLCITATSIPPTSPIAKKKQSISMSSFRR